MTKGEVTASWGTEELENGTTINLHKLLVDCGIDLEEASFSDQETGVLKAGAVYPDKGALDPEVPYHGRRHKNWIASYKYITAVAKAVRFCNGNLTYPSASDVLGSNSNYYLTEVGKIQTDFTLAYVMYYKDNPNGEQKTWPFVMQKGGITITGFDSLSQSVQLYLKSLFIYGVALHDLTDTFAHAAYAEAESGAVQPIVHDGPEYVAGQNLKDADTRADYPKRWTDAKYASQKLIQAAVAGVRGKIIDFAPHVTDASRGYYLQAPKDKACTLNNTTTNQTIFYYIDYGSYDPSQQ